MTLFTRTIVAAVIAAGWLAAGHGQEPLARRARVADLTAPAIDRGLRDNDPPRLPRTSESHLIDRSGRREPYLRGSIIVKFREAASSSARFRALSAVNGTRGRSLTYTDFDIVAIDPGADPEAVARELSARPDVEYAQARYRLHADFVPNDPLYRRQWNFPTLDMERAWDLNRGASSSVIVAVLDSGAAFRNTTVRFNGIGFDIPGTSLVYPSLGIVDVPFAAAPELGGSERFVAPFDFIWNDPEPLDMDGHGTHVAGTVGQLTNNSVGVAGMAFNVRLMPVKVIDGDWDFVFNSPEVGTDDVVARGIRYAADNGAKVINLSIGRTGRTSPVLKSAVQYAVSRGAFLSIAAGNDFQGGNPPNVLAEFAREIDGAVAVGSIDRDRVRAFYSNTGPYIELMAPGGDQRRHGTEGGILQQTYDFDFVDTFSLGPSRFRPPRFDIFVYDFYQGTSMAAPHVSGFAALLYQQGITSPAAIEAAMKRYAIDLGPPGTDNEYGEGLINPRAALRGMGLLR